MSDLHHSPEDIPAPDALEPPTGATSPLRDAIRRVRVVNADRADSLADLRDAERARLDLLADDLADLAAEVPDDHDFFAFARSDGETPRLWIDMTCHVALGRDRRTYRLLKDTRLGRTILAETADRAEMAKRIADYVAERVIDRQRAIEGDWIALKGRKAAPADMGETLRAGPPLPANEDRPGVASPVFDAGHDVHVETARASRGAKWVALFLGVLIGAGGLAGLLMYLGRL